VKKNTVFILIFFLCVGLTGCVTRNETLERIKYFCGVNIPEEAQIVYNFIDSSFGGQGHGPQYTVFNFEEEPTDFFTSDFSYGGKLYWTSPDGEKQFTPVVSGTLSFTEGRMSIDEENDIDDIIAWCKVPNEHLPNWESEYIYYKQALNYLVYFKESKTLIYVYHGY
jgi:hypothetical protein